HRAATGEDLLLSVWSRRRLSSRRVLSAIHGKPRHAGGNGRRCNAGDPRIQSLEPAAPYLRLALEIARGLVRNPASLPLVAMFSRASRPGLGSAGNAMNLTAVLDRHVKTG